MRAAAERVATMLATMLAVSFIVYAVLEVNAAEVAVKVLGQFSSETQRRLWLHQNGYDLPFLVRYANWLWRFATLHWGVSTHYRADVLPMVLDRLGKTGILGGLTLLVMVPTAFVTGVLAGVREGSTTDRVLSFASVLTTSVPEFASAVLLSAIFVFWLHWLPGASTMTAGFSRASLYCL